MMVQAAPQQSEMARLGHREWQSFNVPAMLHATPTAIHTLKGGTAVRDGMWGGVGGPQQRTWATSGL